MNCIHIVQSKTRYMGRLSRGSDILEAVNELCRREGIRLGRVEAIGAVEKARLGYYDQQAREYRYNQLDRPLEITSLSGNISLRDGEPFVHAHITLADSDGRTYGGHLAEGNIAFACEFMVEVFEGAPLERRFDEETDLYLWEPSS
ncbi:MAG: DNA-binding protein [delta proteobacterium MLS_D]|jgi:uncharacterized protein|nr:MAG: DNA-binding protein [delta proteobacterium MLS_D]